METEKYSQQIHTFILDVEYKRNNVLHLFNKQRESLLIIGWEDIITQNITVTNNNENNTMTTIFLKGFQL